MKDINNIIGYQFKDEKLLHRALTHRSKSSRNNERLEFLGDAVLGFIIADYLFQKYPNANEGDLSRLRSVLVKGRALAKVAKSLRVGDFLRMGPGEQKSGGHRRESILADAMEAILGAVYLDGGYDAVKGFVFKSFSQALDRISIENVTKDSKTLLQEFLQAKSSPLPIYCVESVCGADHEQLFHVSCEVEGLNDKVFGTGSSRRNAEQDAATQALTLLSSSDSADAEA